MERFPTIHDKLDAGVMREPSYGGLSLDLASQTLTNTETHAKVKLTDTEYQVLWLLIRSQGGVIKESEATEFIYDDDTKDLPLSNTIETMIGRLRKKLKEVAGDSVKIEATRGFGYTLVIKD